MRLTVNGKEIYLPTGANITMELQNNFFQFDEVEGSYTYSFDVDNTDESTRAALGYAYRSDQTGDKFAEQPAMLEVGLLTFVGKLKVLESSPRKSKVFFKTDSGDLGSLKARSIRDLCTAAATFDPETDLNVSAYVPARQLFCFPRFSFKTPGGDKLYPNHLVNREASGVYGSFIGGITPILLPFPNLYQVITNIFGNVGYTVSEYFSATRPSILDVVMYNNRCIVPLTEIFFNPGTGEDEWYPRNPAQIRAADHIPAWTLGKFISEVRKNFGLMFDIKPNTKTVNIRLVDDILADQAYTEWTDKADPRRPLKPYPRTAYFSHKEAPGYFAIQNERLPEASVKPAVNSLADLPSIGNTIGDIRLVLRENIYLIWRKNQLNGNNEWREYDFPGHPYGDKDSPNKIESDCAPVHAPRHWYYEISATATNNSSKLRLELIAVNPVNGSILTVQEVRVMNSELYPSEWFTVVRGAGNLYDCPTVDFQTGTPSSLDIEARHVVGVYQPTVDEGANCPEFGAKKEDWTPGFLFYWGGGYASPHPYNFAGAELGNLALRWTGERGIVEQLYPRYLEFLATTLQADYLLRLTESDLANWRREKRVRIRDVNYFPIRIKLSFTASGLRDTSETELLRVFTSPPTIPPVMRTVTIRYLTNCATTPTELSQSSASQADGTTTDYTLTAPTGYDMDSIEVDSSPVTVANPNSQVIAITANADVLVEVCLVAEPPPTTYAITVQYFGFTADPNPTPTFPATATEFEDFTVSFAPAGSGPGYEISSIFVSTVDTFDVVGNAVTIFNVSQAALIQVYAL